MIRAIASTTLLIAGSLYGQTAAPARFEVASIKSSKADPRSSGINTTPGRLNAINVTVKRCIMGAYGVGRNQISGGPDWLDSDRFDITATGEQPAGDHALMAMLQTLLAERFKLALHRESKPTQAYVLQVAKNGLKLEKGDGRGATSNSRNGTIAATNASMDRFADLLSRQMDLPVVNRTSLEGVFNLKLEWTPDTSRLAKSTDSAVLEGPSLFTAVQEQLGLRLSAQRVPIEVLVIDHLERPSEN